MAEEKKVTKKATVKRTVSTEKKPATKKSSNDELAELFKSTDKQLENLEKKQEKNKPEKIEDPVVFQEIEVEVPAQVAKRAELYLYDEEGKFLEPENLDEAIALQSKYGKENSPKTAPVFKWYLVIIYVLIALVAAYGVFLLKETVENNRIAAEEADATTTTTTTMPEFTTKTPYINTTTDPDYWFTYYASPTKSKTTKKSTTNNSSTTEEDKTGSTTEKEKESESVKETEKSTEESTAN